VFLTGKTGYTRTRGRRTHTLGYGSRRVYLRVQVDPHTPSAHLPPPGFEPVGGEPRMSMTRGQCDAKPNYTAW